MKKFRLLNWVLVALAAFYFTSCGNEPLVGEFIQPDDPTVIENGQFKAQIDGVEFIATVVNATLTPEDLLVISGVIEATGETIMLTADDAGVGSFNLVTAIGNVNGAQYYPPGSTTNPYTSAAVLDGSGQLSLTEFNTADMTITGSFSFVGKRIQLDSNGDPVLDGNGDPNVQDITVTPGGFNKISYVLDDTGGTGGGGAGGDPVDEFTALIDDVEFFEDTITTTVTTIGSIEMLKIVAQTSTNSLIRIDVPLFTGIGTFPMESISDGTKIVALYNSNTGGENLTSNPGSITITELDTEEGIIIATFEFSGTDPLGGDPTVVAVTSGEMTIYFDGIPGSGPKPFTAEVDSILYEPDPTDIDINIGLQAGVERVTLSTTLGGQSMSLTFPKNIVVGSYDMSTSLVNPENVVAIYNPVIGSNPNFVSSPGMLIIESYDTMTGKIMGTFSYTGIDRSGGDPTTYDVANGSFKVIIE
ncbi:MAG: hypothetical protein ACI9OS_001289 [Ulvibacter sp.]|jgi:hypothetical protein